jgi:hypothetical protein
MAILVGLLLGLGDDGPPRWPCPACAADAADALGGSDRVADAVAARRSA